MTPTVATVLGVAVLVFIVVWVAVWRKARKTGEAENPWEGAFDVPLVAETSSEDTPCEKPTTIVEDAPTPTVETDLTVSVVNEAVPAETPEDVRKALMKRIHNREKEQEDEVRAIVKAEKRKEKAKHAKYHVQV